MATTPEYFYLPVFGVEDYAANGVPQSSQFGGGAKESHDNLIVSMWANLDGPEPFLPDEGDLLKPSTEFGDFGSVVFGTNAFKNLVTAGSGKQFPSRNAAKFHLDGGISKSLNPPLLVVLDPPAAMKQRLAGAIASVEGAANPEGWIVDFAKSVSDIFDWRVQAEGSPTGEGRNTTTGGIFTFYGGVASDLPLLKTNGADGNFPQFYASVQTSVPTTVGALRELKAALDSGDFYVPLFIFPDESAMDIIIEYPHSSGRN